MAGAPAHGQAAVLAGLCPTGFGLMAAFACNGRGIAMTMVMGTGWTRQGS